MEKGICKYYRSPFLNEECKKGINYLDLTGGNRLEDKKRLPCFIKHETAIKCELYCEPSDEEIEEEEELEFKKAIDRILKVQPFIEETKQKYKDTGGAGTTECPICKGKLHWTVSSYNGHMHGKCETDNCLFWME